jgi:hypothetical protein
MTDRKKVGQMSREEWEAKFGSLGKARPTRQAAPIVVVNDPRRDPTGETRWDETAPAWEGFPSYQVADTGSDVEITREQFEAMKGRPVQADIDVVNPAGIEDAYNAYYAASYQQALSQGFNQEVANTLAHDAAQTAVHGAVRSQAGPQSEVMAAVVDDALKQQALEQIVQASAQGDINLGGIRQAPAAAKAPYTEPMAVVTDAMEAAPVPVAPSGERMAMRYPAGILAALLGGGALWELVDEDPRRAAAV